MSDLQQPNYNLVTFGNTDVFGLNPFPFTFQPPNDSLLSQISLCIGGITEYFIVSQPVIHGGTINGSFIVFGIQQTKNQAPVFDRLRFPFIFPEEAQIIETDNQGILIKQSGELLISSTVLTNILTVQLSDNQALVAPTLTFDVIYPNGDVNHCSFDIIIHVFGPVEAQTSDLLVAPIGNSLVIQFKGGKPPFTYMVADGLYYFSDNSRSVLIHDPDFLFSSTTSVLVYDAWFEIIEKIIEHYTLSLQASLTSGSMYLPGETLVLGLEAATTDIGTIVNYYASGTLFKHLPSDFNSAAFLPVNYISDTGVKTWIIMSKLQWFTSPLG